MQTRPIGNSGIEVGAVGLGCVGMSAEYGPRERDDKESMNVLRRAVELGVTLFDTADSYGPFTNEELLGRTLRRDRANVVISTKCGLVIDSASGRARRDGRPEHVRNACEASLRRLKTDVIDLYHLHRVDPDVPLEDTWGAMASLVDDGKVRALGLSEVGISELELVHSIHPVSSVQSEFSLWTRGARNDVLPWCESHSVSFIPFAPLGRGFLTGSITSAGFDPKDIRATNPRFTASAIEQNQEHIVVLRDVAERAQSTPAQIAIAWTLAQGDMVVPIPGTKKVQYLEENAAACYVSLSPEMLNILDRLPEPVGERY